MKFLIFCILFGLGLFFPFTRCLIFHPFNTFKYFILDIFHYFAWKQYNICESGFIDCYCGLFGQGKTVSAVNRIVSDYKKYNGKKFYSPRHGWVTSRIHILSNVELVGVPYEKLTSLQQLVDWTAYVPDHPGDFCIACIDEASCILNNRDYMKNFDYFSLNALVTCRHFRLGIVLTSQRFALIDKLLRSVCQTVYQCRKTWRVIEHGIYDAYELENVSNPLLLKPKRVTSFFCTNKTFERYDTLATVGEIKKACKEGKMKTNEEILASIVPAEDPIPDKMFKKKYRNKS